MIKFYLKFQNNMLTKNLLYIITSFVLFFNILIRVMPEKFIPVFNVFNNTSSRPMIPQNLFVYCDVYLLMLFIILIFFFLGSDFNNSMEEIALVVGGSKTNKFMIRKLASILILYAILYFISFCNIYLLYKGRIGANEVLLPMAELLLYSITTNIFVISLSIFILLISRDIAVSTSLITAYYLIEESLWRCKITQTNGILGHIYQYYDYEQGELLKVKLVYMLLSIILLFSSYKLSQRKIHLKSYLK
jgi:hypothetical protein